MFRQGYDSGLAYPQVRYHPSCLKPGTTPGNWAQMTMVIDLDAVTENWLHRCNGAGAAPIIDTAMLIVIDGCCAEVRRSRRAARARLCQPVK